MIDKALAAFLQEGIGIQLGTRSASLEPNGVLVPAVKVDDEGTHLVAYVPEVALPQVLPDLEDNGQVAIVFGRPPDERACQVKGVFTGTHVPSEAERRFVLDQWDRWLARLETIGYPRVAFAHWITWPCVGMRLRVTALFNQTPGPGAGAAL
jgi:hypothetical protein